MKWISKSVLFDAPPSAVFNAFDDPALTGMHMSSPSALMLGTKLTMTFLTEEHQGEGTMYSWNGTVFFLPVDFIVKVQIWEKDAKKVWDTVDQANLIIYR